MFQTSLCPNAIFVLLNWRLRQQVEKQRTRHLTPFMKGKKVKNQEMQLRQWSGLPKTFIFNEQIMSKLRDLQHAIEASPFENIFNTGTEESMPYGTRLSIATRANLVHTFGESGALDIVRNFAYRMRSVKGSDFTHLQRFQNTITWILQEKAPLEARRLIIRGKGALDLPLRSLFMRALPRGSWQPPRYVFPHAASNESDHPTPCTPSTACRNRNCCYRRDTSHTLQTRRLSVQQIGRMSATCNPL